MVGLGSRSLGRHPRRNNNLRLEPAGRNRVLRSGRGLRHLKRPILDHGQRPDARPNPVSASFRRRVRSKCPGFLRRFAVPAAAATQYLNSNLNSLPAANRRAEFLKSAAQLLRRTDSFGSVFGVRTTSAAAITGPAPPRRARRVVARRPKGQIPAARVYTAAGAGRRGPARRTSSLAAALYLAKLVWNRPANLRAAAS